MHIQSLTAPKNRASSQSIPRIIRAFTVLRVKKIRCFADFQAASRYIDLRLAQNPAFCFNIQQTAQGWIVSRVVA